MTVVYTPQKPRYVIRQNGEHFHGYPTLDEARTEADRMQYNNPEYDYDVIDIRPEGADK